MNATDVISREEAKLWLNTDSEVQLDRMIRGAIDFVENYTGYRLFEREVTIQVPYCNYGISLYPLTIESIKNKEGETVTDYKTKSGVYSTFLYGVPLGSIITAKVGYLSILDIPPTLLDAAYKALTYLFENRDVYQDSTTSDLRMMLKKYRRSLV